MSPEPDIIYDHEVLVMAHWHNDSTSGLEISCSCGAILFTECSPDPVMALSEIQSIAEKHRG
jgi:hypothetical protein